MHARGREQRRNRHQLCAGRAVGQHQNRFSFVERLLRRSKERLQPGFESLRRVEHHVHFRRGKPGNPREQPFEVRGLQNRRTQMDLAAVVRLVQRRVAVRTEEHVHTGDALFLHGVDRRVRDLRKELLKIVEQRLRTLGEHRNRRVVAHRPDGIEPRLRDWQHRDHAIFIRPAKQVLAFLRARRGLALPPVGKLFELDHLLGKPLFPWPGQILILNRLILQQHAGLGVQQQHLVRTETPATNHVGRRNVQHAGLRREHEKVVLREHPAGGTQAVSIQHRADLAAVRHAHRGGAVPRGHQAGGVAVEVALVLVQRCILRPRAGHHHKQRLRQRAPGDDKKL